MNLKPARNSESACVPSTWRRGGGAKKKVWDPISFRPLHRNGAKQPDMEISRFHSSTLPHSPPLGATASAPVKSNPDPFSKLDRPDPDSDPDPDPGCSQVRGFRQFWSLESGNQLLFLPSLVPRKKKNSPRKRGQKGTTGPRRSHLPNLARTCCKSKSGRKKQSRV